MPYIENQDLNELKRFTNFELVNELQPFNEGDAIRSFKNFKKVILQIDKNNLYFDRFFLVF